MKQEMLERFALDRDVVFLNHGSFGACPRVVLDEQTRWRTRMERQPVQFFARDLEALLDGARVRLAAAIGASPSCTAFVPNATAGVNAVVRSMSFWPGDELLTTSHAYNACKNVLELAARQASARVVIADLPLPLTRDDVVEAVLSKVSAQTRLVLLDHVTSPTAAVLPLERIVPVIEARGVPVLVDGAHAPGMIPLDVTALGASFYTGNCHKWLCAPKGAGFLVVRRDRLDDVRPAIISHGANSPRTDRSRFLLEFDWTGTADPTALLSIPAALDFLEGALPGGLDEVRARNRALVLEGAHLLAGALGTQPLCAEEEMIGSMCSLPLPQDAEGPPPMSALYADPLQEHLLQAHRIEVPIVPWPQWPKRLVRISAHLYNDISDYQSLARVLRA